MAQSVSQKIRRGNMRMIFNPTFRRYDFYRRTSKGRFILCHPWSGRDLATGPGYAKKQLDSWEKNAA